ncbi:hypothetical protein [Halomicrobium salinisoli]|uniref:hypothetical protein n=1 Tax=Halomicrobium salinisoli TaxID=2878391 RepID=UPI001CF091AF|nr:hypothetical protein [Halomicrobium salinisoli]
MKSILSSQSPEQEMESAAEEMENAIRDYVEKSVEDAHTRQTAQVEMTRSKSSDGSGGSKFPLLLAVGAAVTVAYMLRRKSSSGPRGKSGSGGDMMKKASSKIEEVATQTADETEQMSHEAADTVRQTGQQVSEMSDQAADTVEEKGERASDQVEEKGEQASDKMEEKGEQASDDE